MGGLGLAGRKLSGNISAGVCMVACLHTISPRFPFLSFRFLLFLCLLCFFMYGSIYISGKELARIDIGFFFFCSASC